MHKLFKLSNPKPAFATVLLFTMAFIMLFGQLGLMPLWTLENRWASVTLHMFYSGDYLHPYIDNAPYYDKPLLSYWLQIFFSWFTGGLNAWSLRIPSALAGFLSIVTIYRFGLLLANRRFALICAWLLLSTYYFIYWSRMANANMLTVFGVLLAVFWYFKTKDHATFKSYAVFFIIMTLTSLCKGLTGFILPTLMILPDLLYRNHWLKHCRPTLLLAIVVALVIYLLPFWLSAHFDNLHYAASGLFEVFRENFIRYTDAYDNIRAWYVYFYFFPLYITPWIILFIPALINLALRWKKLPYYSRWLFWATLLPFLFFTLSESRRDYYILPLVPFALMVTADFCQRYWDYKYFRQLLKTLILLSISLNALYFLVGKPVYYYGGLHTFANQVRATAEKQQAWSHWHLVLIDEIGTNAFYLQPTSLSTYINENDWALLATPKKDTIYITQAQFLPQLKPYLQHYTVIKTPLTYGEKLLHVKNDTHHPIALIPTDAK